MSGEIPNHAKTNHFVSSVYLECVSGGAMLPIPRHKETVFGIVFGQSER